MAQISSKYIQDPFGEVNAWKQPDGTVTVKATVRMKPNVENAQTGLAIDASSSMKNAFGVDDSGLSALFAPKLTNYVEIVARKIAAYLANFDSDGETTALYYSCGKLGTEIQPIGEIDSKKSETQNFTMPSNPGTGTRLVPAINYFLNHFKNAPWLICLFITDGLIDDIEETKVLSKKICQEMADGTRQFTKFVIIGIGNDFGPGSPASVALEELDDLDEDEVYGVEGQDLWDHKITADMKSLDEIFAEVVSENTILCSGASIVDSNGKEVKTENGESYSDGLPALLRFTMSAGSNSFTLRLPSGVEVTQDLSSVL